MSNVLTVEAKLNGDASGLVAATKRAAAGLRDLEQAGSKTARLGPKFQELGYNIGVALGGAIGVAGRFGNRLIDVTSRVIKTLGRMTLRAGLAGAAVATVFGGMAIKAGLDRLMSIQDATVALTRMLGSAEKAADLTGKALAVVKGTPFAFPQFAEATRTLVAFGVKTEKIPKILQAIADSAAASGRGAEAVNGITQAFARMAVTGKINSDIIESLGSAGVNAIGILANHFKVSTGEAQKMVSEGLIPAEKAMDILVDGIENGSKGIAGNFNALKGAAQDLGKTVSGSLANVKAAFARMGATWLKPFEVDFPKVLNEGVIPLLDKVGEAGAKLTKKLADTGMLDKLTDGFKSLIKFVDPATDGFLGMIAALSPLGIVIKAVQSVLPVMGSHFAEIGALVGGKLVPALADLLVGMVPLLPAFTELLAAGIAGFIQVLPTVVSLISALAGVIRPLAGLVASLPGPFLGVIAVLGTLQAMGIPVTTVLSTLGNKLLGLGTTATVAGTTISTAGKTAFGPWGVALAVVGTVIGGFLLHQQSMKQAIDDVAASLDAQTGAVTESTKAIAVKTLTEGGAYKAATTLGISFDTVTRAAMGEKAALDEIKGAHNRLKEAGGGVTGMNGELVSAFGELNRIVGISTGTIDKAKQADQLKAQAMGTVKNATQLFTQATQQASGAVSKNGRTLNTATAAGMANKAALDKMGAAANVVTDAMYKEGRSNSAVAGSANVSRAAFSRMAQSMGMGKSQADALAVAVILIPTKKNVSVSVKVDGMGLLDALRSRIGSINSKTVSVTAGVQKFGIAKGGVVRAMASGGFAGSMQHTGTARKPMIAKGGANITWAEPETGWEAYISGNKKHKQRNKEVWMEAGEKLGMFNPVATAGGGGNQGAPTRSGGNAPVIVNINAPVVTPNGTLIGMIRGIAGEQIEFRFEEEALKKDARFRR